MMVDCSTRIKAYNKADLEKQLFTGNIPDDAQITHVHVIPYGDKPSSYVTFEWKEER